MVSAAIAVADSDGLAALSMRRVAESLGVGTMTLYTYVPGKAELIDLMVDAAIGDAGLPAEPPADWRAGVVAFAEAARALQHKHSWLLHITTARPALGPNVMANEEFLLAALVRSGMTATEVASTSAAIQAFLAGAIRYEVELVLAERRTGQSDDQWWTDRSDFWETYFDMERHPAMTKVWQDGGFDTRPTAFETGLARLLDGIAANLPG